MTDSLGLYFPKLAARLPKSSIADLPTPLKQYSLRTPQISSSILVKHDDLSSKPYGGNKIRKLEYILRRAIDRDAERVATFGTVASNHALATALYATALDLKCTCLLSHQSQTAKAPMALNMHLRNRTEIIRFGGARRNRIDTMRKYLQNRRTWVIPMGGSSWLGVVGFVNAGLEAAAQFDAAGIDIPDRLYVANGTMGTAAGIALGLALANIPTEVHAVRVTHEFIANPTAMQRLVSKTAAMMNRLDPTVPADIAARTKLRYRDEFFAGGYAKSNSETERAIEFGREEIGLTLDATYSGKAMAALLHDLSRDNSAENRMMFWNTYNSRVLPVTAERPEDTSRLPEEFLRYYV